MKVGFSDHINISPKSNRLALEELEISKLKEVIQDMKEIKVQATPEQPKLEEGKINETPIYDYLKKLEGDVSPSSLSNKNTSRQEFMKWHYYFPSFEFSKKENLKIIFFKSNVVDVNENAKGLMELQINITNISIEQITKLQLTLKNSGSIILFIFFFFSY